MSTTVKPSADAAAIHNTREAVRSQPGLGNLTFQMKARSSGGLTVRTRPAPQSRTALSIPVAWGNFLISVINPQVYSAPIPA